MLIGTSKDETTAKEAMQVYHMIQHNQSFESMKSKIIRVLYGEKDFKCSASKATAIVSGVFEPMIINQIESELENAHFVTIALKMFPIIIRYFLPTEGVKVRLIELNHLPGETGKQIFEMLEAAWSKWNIQNKLVGYSADNAPVNFGSVDRTGDKNVFHQMQEKFNNKLVGVGCLAHVLHNTPNNACLTNIPYDFNQILTLIYKQFNTSTKQSEALKTFCKEMDVEFRKIKSCPNTRFIAKKGSINSVLRVLDPLKSYVDSDPSKKVPLVVKRFLDDPFHKFYLILVRDLCAMFEDAVLKIEGNNICGNEAIKIVKNVQSKLESQINGSFISIDAEQALREVCQANSNADTTDEMETDAADAIEADMRNSIENIALPLYRKYISAKNI